MSRTVPAAGDGPIAAEAVYIARDDVSAAAITRSLQALLPARVSPIAPHQFTVLDTVDGRVRRAGARLTRSGVNGTATLAWQSPGGRNRFEVGPVPPVHFAWDLDGGPLRHELAPVIGVRRLLPQADAEGCGALLEILDSRGKTVARVRIESGRARRPTPGAGWQRLPTFVTLTGLRGYEDEYERLVPVIESRPGLEPCPEGCLGVMLRAIGAPAPCDGSSLRVELDRAVRADAGARQVHLALVALIVANESGIRSNLDTEFLHDFRVAVRRTRSLLGQIRRVFPPERVEHFSTELSWLGRLTGPPRDLDVLVLALLRNLQTDGPPDDMPALTELLQGAQLQEHRTLVAAIDGERYRRLISDWQAFLVRPPSSQPAPPNAGRLLVEVVSRRAWVLSRRIARSARTIDARTEAGRLHAVRIDAKKLRYLVDAARSFYEARDLEPVLGALKKLQRVLGDFNDAHVQERRLLECGRAMAAAGGSAGDVLAIGRLAGQSRQRGERLRGDVAAALARFGARDIRSSCRRAFKGTGSAERLP